MKFGPQMAKIGPSRLPILRKCHVTSLSAFAGEAPQSRSRPHFATG